MYRKQQERYSFLYMLTQGDCYNVVISNHSAVLKTYTAEQLRQL